MSAEPPPNSNSGRDIPHTAAGTSPMTNKTKHRRATGRTVRNVDDAKRREFFRKYLFYLDGLALYADAECPTEEKPFIRMGWGIGRQMVSQYVVEMLLRIRLEAQGVHGTETHNLASLYGRLPENDANAVENVYKRILNAEVAWTWDVYETVASFFDFLGRNPIKHTQIPVAAAARGDALLARQLPSAYIRALHRAARVSGSRFAGQALRHGIQIVQGIPPRRTGQIRPLVDTA